MQPSHRHIPAHIRRYVHFYADKHCGQCGVRLLVEDILYKPTIDHIVAVAQGGGGDLFNLQILCLRCNIRKSAKLEGKDLDYAIAVEKRNHEIAAYFHRSEARIKGNRYLRHSQLEAYMAMGRHFDSAEGAQPAIVEVPTGAGKTGIIAIAPFDLARGRVLVLAPNLTIKDGLEIALGGARRDRLDDNFYVKTHVFERANQLPRVVVLRRGLVNKEDLLRADIVIANVQQMSAWLLRSQYFFPENFFDMVIVDEAHHAPAPTWQGIEHAFPRAKKLYLTATPFRSDNQPLVGRLVYRYRLSEAIARGHVKNIEVIIPEIEKITFVMRGRNDEITLNDILKIREEDWFSKDIALSPLCNRNLIDKACAVLMDLRERTRYHHQMIAVACSRNHARELVRLFEAKGLRATYVESIEMTVEERERRLRAYEKGLYDVVIHVGILGEGYDHKSISVAVIFRPFRSAPPYIQFVGRALRYIPQLSREHNGAYVVQHPGLNVDRWWEYFKIECDEARHLIDIIERKKADAKKDPMEPDEERPPREPYQPNGTVVQELISGWMRDPYLHLSEAEKQRVQALQAELESIYGAKLVIKPNATEVSLPVNRPDLERHEWRKTLHQHVKKVAGDLCFRLNVHPSAKDLIERLGKPDAIGNYQAIIRVLNNRLNQQMGHDEKNKRVEWTQDTFIKATHTVYEVSEQLFEELKPLAPGPTLNNRMMSAKDILKNRDPDEK